MNTPWTTGLRQPGVAAVLGAALLFGAGTPLAKLLLAQASPWLLAGLLYLGSGLGLGAVRRLRRAPAVQLSRAEWPWLAGAVLAGGVVGPVLLMLGLTRMPASGASLLLNAEGVFTALLAWLAFRENVDRRIALGMTAIALGAAVLSWPGQARFAGAWPALAVLGACLAWAIDNNLTRKVSANDAMLVACLKGLLAGACNTGLALAAGAALPASGAAAAALGVGFLGYGLSLTLFVVGLRTLGTARTGAYFSVAPLFGVLVSLLLWPQRPTLLFWSAAVLMAVGVWLHLRERHEHEHTHEPLEHAHAHRHDAHHRHAHDFDWDGVEPHVHVHRHLPLMHRHPHYPDIHHRHGHAR